MCWDEAVGNLKLEEKELLIRSSSQIKNLVHRTDEGTTPGAKKLLSSNFVQK